MAIQLNITQARVRLSELIHRAEAGEEVVITRRGKPIVTLTITPSSPPNESRPLGIWAHYGPLTEPNPFSRHDPEIETWVDKSIFPED